MHDLPYEWEEGWVGFPIKEGSHHKRNSNLHIKIKWLREGWASRGTLPGLTVITTSIHRANELTGIEGERVVKTQSVMYL